MEGSHTTKNTASGLPPLSAIGQKASVFEMRNNKIFYNSYENQENSL